MANKLKEIFTDNVPDLGFGIQFKNKEFYTKFLEKMDTVLNEGCSATVEGVQSLSTNLVEGEREYPFLNQENLEDVVMGPSKENVVIDLNTEIGNSQIMFERYMTNNDIIVETDIKDIVYLKFKYNKMNLSSIKFTYQIQPENAKNVKEIIERLNTTIVFIEKMFYDDKNQNLLNENTPLKNMKDLLCQKESLFKKILSIEQVLGIVFDFAQFNVVDNLERNIEELYILLIRKEVLRLDAKLTSTESTKLEFSSEPKNIEIGSRVDFTFFDKKEFKILNNTITIYTANLLTNAIIKDIKVNKDGITQVLYDDYDSKPMYISYSGFKNIEKAKKELKTIFNNNEKYINALTLNEYMKNNAEHY